jgi:phosphohistidine phosphatase
LIVMRHAKSDWNAGAETDHARPLNARGRREAPKVGELLRERKARPDLVLSSDSNRTRQTFEGLEKGLGELSVRFEPSLYHAGLSEVRALATTVPTTIGTLMVLGHNPGWETMVLELSGEPIEMKTADAAILTSDAATWPEALVGPMKLVEIVRVD